MRFERQQFSFVGKWMEAEASDLGIQPNHPPEQIVVSGIRPGIDTEFVAKRVTTRRRRMCAEYSSFAGRQLRVWLDGQKDTFVDQDGRQRSSYRPTREKE